MIEKSFGMQHTRTTVSWEEVKKDDNKDFEFQCPKNQAVSGLQALGSGADREYHVGCSAMDGIAFDGSAWFENKVATDPEASFAVKCPKTSQVMNGIGSKMVYNTDGSADRTFYISCLDTNLA